MNRTTYDNAKIADIQLMLRGENVDLASRNHWEEIVRHIEVHRYLMDQHVSWRISWSDATFSWYENVFLPVRRALEHLEIERRFPNRSIGLLYLGVANHWQYLKEHDPDILAEEAVQDFADHYGEGLTRWFSRFLQPNTG